MAAGIERLAGRVLNKMPDGLLVITGSSQVFLIRDHPAAASLVDGESIGLVEARADGDYQYRTTLGALATVHAYRAAVPAAP